MAAPAFQPFVDNYGSLQGFNRAVHIWTDPRFVYVTNPKVACSSTKASLNLEVARRAGLDFGIERMEQIHDRGHNPLKTPRQVGPAVFAELMADPGTVRFAFVRDPVVRFCSAYLSKLHPSRRGSAHRKRLMAHLGRPMDDPLPLDEFAALAAADRTVRDFDPHWRLQRMQIAYDLIDYSFIGDQSRYAADFAAITARIFGAPVAAFDTRAAFGRRTGSGNAAAEISPATRRAVETAYADDFAMIEDIARRGLGATAA